MKKCRLWLMLLLGSIFLIQACKNDDEDLGSMNRQEFVNRATSSSMMEVQAGQMAQEKAVSAEVKQFAAGMIQDHTAANTQLAAVASGEGLTVPTTLLPEHQAHITNLSTKTGVEFDQAYADLMVLSHQEAVTLFDQASNNIFDEQLNGFARQQLPILQEHLQMAQSLDATINP